MFLVDAIYIMQIVDHCPPQETLIRLRNKPTCSTAEICWPDVLVNARYSTLEKEIPESAFTIFTVIDEGYVHINMDHKSFRFCNETLFVVNPYESFSYRISEASPLHMVNIHLSLDTYQNMISTILLNDEELLEDPEEVLTYSFSNHIHLNRSSYKSKLLSLSNQSSEDFQSELLNNLTQMIMDDRQGVQRIPSLRSSTRRELYRRVAMGRDIIFSKYNDPQLTVDELSREVYMSKFHFIRVFKETFGITPHQLIRDIRIRKALDYIKEGKLTYSAIAYKIGLQEANSLYPLIREHRYQLT